MSNDEKPQDTCNENQTAEAWLRARAADGEQVRHETMVPLSEFLHHLAGHQQDIYHVSRENERLHRMLDEYEKEARHLRDERDALRRRVESERLQSNNLTDTIECLRETIKSQASEMSQLRVANAQFAAKPARPEPSDLSPGTRSYIAGLEEQVKTLANRVEGLRTQLGIDAPSTPQPAPLPDRDPSEPAPVADELNVGDMFRLPHAGDVLWKVDRIREAGGIYLQASKVLEPQYKTPIHYTRRVIPVRHSSGQ